MNVALYLNSPAGTSYAVTKLGYQGYVKLERGMTAEQSAYYTFAGSGAVEVNDSNMKASRNIFVKAPADTAYAIESFSASGQHARRARLRCGRVPAPLCSGSVIHAQALALREATACPPVSWSDCATQRTLLLHTRIMRTNEARPPAFGSMTMTRVDADTSFIDVDVDWQRCPEPPPLRAASVSWRAPPSVAAAKRAPATRSC